MNYPKSYISEAQQIIDERKNNNGYIIDMRYEEIKKKLPVAKKYILGTFELIPCRDFRKVETGQYIDFQTYAPDLDNRLVEFLSVILVPKGHRYNDGYQGLIHCGSLPQCLFFSICLNEYVFL